MWGEHRLPKVCSYRYLGIDFACNGARDVHVKEVIDSGRTKLSTVNLSARGMLVLALVRLILEYGNEV